MIQPSLRHLLAMVILLATPGLLGAAPGRDTPETPAQPAPESSFEFGDRPSQPVFDLTGTLPTATLTEISSELDSIRTNDGIDIMVVVLKDLGGAPPEHVAGSFGKAWCSPLFHCVVLHVPGDPDGPWIVPGGKLLRRFSAEAVRTQIAAARHRASVESGEAEKVRAATTEASDMLRIWVGDGVYLTTRHNAMIEDLRAVLETRKRLKSILIPAVAACLAILLASTFIGVRWLVNHGPRLFPEPDWQRRLGAPYAGGNDSSTLLTRAPAKTHPPRSAP